MRRKSFVLSVILAALLAVPAAFASTLEVQDQNQNANHNTNRRRRHVTRRHRRQGIKEDYAGAGKSAGHGGKRFGKNIKHGRPVKAGKELGKGMGDMGKGVGHGTKQVGKKVGKGIKKAVTP